MKKTINIICYFLAFCGVTSCIAWFLGYPPTKAENTLIDWQGTTTIIQALSIFALIGTVLYQVYNNNQQTNKQLETNKEIAHKQEEYNKEIAILQQKVTKEIADSQKELLIKQNNIALFEKRYDIYTSLRRIVDCVDFYDGTKDCIDKIINKAISSSPNYKNLQNELSEIQKKLAEHKKMRKCGEGTDKLRSELDKIKISKENIYFKGLEELKVIFDKIDYMHFLFEDITSDLLEKELKILNNVLGIATKIKFMQEDAKLLKKGIVEEAIGKIKNELYPIIEKNLDLN